MAALLLAKALVAAAADPRLFPAAVACVVLAVATLCCWWWGIHSRSVLPGRWPAKFELLRPTGSAGAAATSSTSSSPLRHFTVLCIGMGAVLLAEPLVAAAEQYLHPVAIACAVITFAALVNSAVLSLNFGVAAVGSSNPAHSALAALAALVRLKSPNSPTPPDAKLKESHPAATPPPPPVAEAEAQQPRAAAIAAPALRPHQSRLARAAFVVLAALMSTSWFLDLVAAAAAELRLPWPAVVSTFFVFSVCFYTSVHMFRSFFRARVPAAAAPPWEGIAAIAAVGVGVAACLVAAGGSAYEYAPARI
ncbi:unnamed protein product [Urochloa decumbens]|uniref:Uncharacterized protein n=1 Tax=Urochloa decumbens TaxID=240449 RepID=A0ABC9FTY1_9POAL